MTDIKPIQTSQTTQAASTGLSQEDITRLPKNYNTSSSGLQADAYESQQESGKAKSTIMTVLLAAAAIVGLKHCGFMKVTPDSTGFIAKFIKKPIAAIGGIIEWPFVKLAGIFKSKPTEAPAPASTPTPDGAKPTLLKKIGGGIQSAWHWFINLFKKKPPLDTTA